MSRLSLLGIAVAIALVVAVGLLIHQQVASDRADQRAAECRRDGPSYREFVKSGGGYVFYLRPKIRQAADSAEGLVGKDRAALRRDLGPPDYVEAKYSAGTPESCEWVYVASGCLHAATTFVPTDTLAIDFNESGRVATTKRTEDADPKYRHTACDKLMDQQRAQAQMRKASSQ
jgi:hypothetical protein